MMELSYYSNLGMHQGSEGTHIPVLPRLVFLFKFRKFYLGIQRVTCSNLSMNAEVRRE